MVEDITFNYMDELGNIKTYTIIEKFSENNKNYIIYQKENNDNLYSALCEYIDDKIKIIPIEKEEDYDIVDKYLESL